VGFELGVEGLIERPVLLVLCLIQNIIYEETHLLGILLFTSLLDVGGMEHPTALSASCTSSEHPRQIHEGGKEPVKQLPVSTVVGMEGSGVSFEIMFQGAFIHFGERGIAEQAE
jgi:hypothetical protein